MPKKLAPSIRYKDKYKIDENTGCWEWTGYRYHGYGILSVNRRPTKAHRFVYELLREKIPKNAILCHTCDNRSCVNPDHVYVGTYADNNRDIRERRGHHFSVRTQCHRGHEYTPENTKYKKEGGARICVQCFRDYQREYQNEYRKKRKMRS